MDAIKERPILFSAPMVRALLNGSKTQTRRIAPIRKLDIQHHGEGMLTWGVHFSNPIKGGILSSHSGGQFTEHDARRIIASQFCPYGKPGDRLWVREAHAMVFEIDIPDGRPRGPIGTMGSGERPGWLSRYVYRADGEMPNVQWHHVGDSQSVRWTPSIHMPRWASRITLEITSVRIERLQDISEADAVAEGCSCYVCGKPMDGRSDGDCHCFHRKASASDYQNLWESINGPGSWAANPFVWVVEFRVAPRERAA